MIIRIYGKNYKIKKNMAVSAKTTIRKILEKVRTESKLKKLEEYYVAFVVMMYVTSAAILRETNVKSIEEIVEEIRKEQEEIRKKQELGQGGEPIVELEVVEAAEATEAAEAARKGEGEAVDESSLGRDDDE